MKPDFRGTQMLSYPLEQDPRCITVWLGLRFLTQPGFSLAGKPEAV